jgi:hypothetical protein
VGEAQTVREACVTDAAKLCPDAHDLDSRIQCMNAHQADLSEGCRKAREANRGARGADSGVVDVDLINIIKEFDLRLHSSAAFRTGSREMRDSAQLQQRLLLCLFGLGTTSG